MNIPEVAVYIGVSISWYELFGPDLPHFGKLILSKN